MMNRGLKAVKAFAFGVVMSGLAVACNEAGQVAKTIAPEAEAVNVSAGKGLQSAQLTAEEREAKKREFFAKPEVKEMSAGLEEIAEAVAVAVEDKDLRDRIYAKCMEKFDGETNVLWQQLDGDDNLRSKGGWSKKIDDLVSKGRKNTIVKSVGNVDAAVKKFEKAFGAPLHLFWIYPSTWDRKTTPLVAFVPFNVDPDTRQSVPAFDSKGNRFELDRKGELAKQRPIVVITYNERTTIDGNGKANMVKGASHESAQVSRTIRVGGKKGSTEFGGESTMSFVSGGSTSVTLNWVTVPNISEEFIWDGGAEWIYTFQIGGRNSEGWEHWWPYTNHVLGNYASPGTFTVGGSHNLVPPGNDDATLTAEFKFYEDDFTVGQYDVFDDWWGHHSWTATSGPNGIITLPQSGSTVTKYDPNYPSVSTVGSYTWQ